jgi:hypothetical protein
LAIAEEPLAWGLELAKKRERRFRKGVKKELLNRRISQGQETNKGSKKTKPLGRTQKKQIKFLLKESENLPI